MPMPTPFDGYVEVPARVSSTSLVSVARNRHSVPCAWAGHSVSVRLYHKRVVIVAEQSVIAEHVRTVDRDHAVHTGSSTFRWSRASRAPCAMGHRLPKMDLAQLIGARTRS